MKVKDIYFPNEPNLTFDGEKQIKIDNVLSQINKIDKIRRFRIWECEYTKNPLISCVYHTGTNGAEGSIKNSLIEVYDVLNQMEKWENVNHVDVADVSIDRPDDLYDFAITLEIK